VFLWDRAFPTRNVTGLRHLREPPEVVRSCGRGGRAQPCACKGESRVEYRLAGSRTSPERSTRLLESRFQVLPPASIALQQNRDDLVSDADLEAYSTRVPGLGRHEMHAPDISELALKRFRHATKKRLRPVSTTCRPPGAHGRALTTDLRRRAPHRRSTCSPVNAATGRLARQHRGVFFPQDTVVLGVCTLAAWGGGGPRIGRRARTTARRQAAPPAPPRPAPPRRPESHQR